MTLSSAAVVCCHAAAVLAQAAPLAEQLFNQGREKEDSGAHTEACVLFEASATLDAQPGARRKVATCKAREGKVTTALAELRAVLEIARGVSGARGQEIQQEIEREIAAAEKKVAKLRLVVPANINPVIMLDGVELEGSAPGDWIRLDPGSHRLKVATPGGGGSSRSFQLREGEERTLDLGALLPPVPPPATPATEPGVGTGDLHTLSTRPGGRAPVRWQSLVGIGLTGLGVASLGGAAALGIQTLSTTDEARRMSMRPGSMTEAEQVRQSALATQNGALACLGVGLALGATGVTVLALSPSGPKDSAPVARVAVHPQGASFQMVW